MNYRLNIRSAAVVAFAAMLGLASCAKAETEDSNEFEKMAFDAWMQKYVLDEGIAAVEQSNGMYVEFFEDGDQAIDASRDTVVWLMLDYTARDLQNNVFATRDSIQALRQRTYTPYTYYVPEYVFCSTVSNYFDMPEGQYFALQNDLVKPDGSTIKLSEGSRVRLYMPSYMAYGTNGYTNDQGYGGQFKLGQTKIVINDLAVKGVVKNPLEYEETLVTQHAIERWGLAETDTIAAMLYVDTLNFSPRAELLAQFPNKPYHRNFKIAVDTTARIWFVGRFLPTAEYPNGFIFDTNIESVYDQFYNRRKNENYGVEYITHEALSYTVKDEDDESSDEDEVSYIPAITKAIPQLRKGQWSRIVFTSAYAYGATGQSKKVQEWQDYYDYMDYYLNNNYYNNSINSSYYDSYYDNYYYNGDLGYYNSSASTSTDEEPTIVTEVQPYTPLMFEIYIEPYEGEDEE